MYTHIIYLTYDGLGAFTFITKATFLSFFFLRFLILIF